MMETMMEQIKTLNGHGSGFASRIETLRLKVASGIKWWAEHQAWPATDEIRIDHRRADQR